jgi:hypothetical protein
MALDKLTIQYAMTPGGYYGVPVTLLDGSSNQPLRVPTMINVPAATNAGMTPLYRMYSDSLDRHFYTSDAREALQLADTITWRTEGTIGYVFKSAAAGLVPLYRLSLPGSDHFYTASPAERDLAISAYQGTFEGIIGYLYDHEVANSTGIFRFATPSGHFYTNSYTEAIQAGNLPGSHFEGVTGFSK